ncbi:2-dehydropantoate 2-reductase [Francisella sp. 19X1-34]|uniref:2-dehydropantoate 2-reductase n=1 Tax=Francisella sp. 19X1-34 TaxID=3087177 RepID=UPI002E2F9F50|nr:2-dehydropantoate 2-reductase [Francisella sp. 19X1-34]MED7789592.1 2-dehydropantoate 2-reductase [Francisella sp. 19X1-34]
MDKSKVIVIFGAGSIGCYIGGKLLSSGYNVTFIGRPRVKENIERNGLKITNLKKSNTYIDKDSIRVEVEPEKILKKAHIIFITVKSKDTFEVAKSINDYASSGALIISLQNGINNIKLLKENILDKTILTGIVSFNIVHQQNGHYHCGTEGTIILEALKNHSEQVVEILSSSSFDIVVTNEIVPIMWGKLIINLNNSINALSGVPLLEELHNKTYRKILAMSMKEALKILRIANIKPKNVGKIMIPIIPYILLLPNFLFKRVAKAMLKIDSKAGSSMLEDLQKGRITEIDYLNGEIIKLGKKYNFSTPINEKILALIMKAEKKANGSPSISATELLCLVKTPN